jgi:hypothetical protein
MKRAGLFAIVGLALAISMAQAVPARPLYEPAEPSKLMFPIDLRESVWIGRLFAENEKVTLHADGTLSYSEGGPDNRGTWRLTGDKLFFQINNFSEYHTTVVGDVIQGTGTNKSGQSCMPLLKRQRQQEKTQW